MWSCAGVSNGHFSSGPGSSSRFPSAGLTSRGGAVFITSQKRGKSILSPHCPGIGVVVNALSTGPRRLAGPVAHRHSCADDPGHVSSSTNHLYRQPLPIAREYPGPDYQPVPFGKSAASGKRGALDGQASLPTGRCRSPRAERSPGLHNCSAKGHFQSKLSNLRLSFLPYDWEAHNRNGMQKPQSRS